VGTRIAAVVLLAGASLVSVPTSSANPRVVSCDGDGTAGNRFQAVYLRKTSQPDGGAASIDLIRRVVVGVDNVFLNSSAKTGGVRRPRWVHDASCLLQVQSLTVADASSTTFQGIVQSLKAEGLNATDRKYVVFAEFDRTNCGEADGPAFDDTAGASNRNNRGPNFAMVRRSCWTLSNGSPSARPMAHEIMHTLGAVQPTAPHSSGNDAHCTDAQDVMCNPPPSGSTPVCPTNPNFQLFDCNNDDYFHTSPPAGSYLATHWNTADNSFLISGGVAPPGPGDPPPVFSSTPGCNSTVIANAFGGAPAVVTFTASDPGGQTVTLSASQLPSFAQFDASTGTLTVAPTIIDWLLGVFGAPRATIVATDSAGNKATCQVTLAVGLF
jgi:hypothetical protein